MTQGQAEFIFGGTAKCAGGNVGWLTLGRGVYCCEREEDAESEEKGVHLRGNVGFGKETEEKKNTEDSG